MAQATNVGSSEDARLGYFLGTTGTTYTDASGMSVSCTFDSWDRTTGQINTLEGDEAIAGFGKLTLTGMTVNIVYTDGETADFFQVVHDEFVVAGGSRLNLQYCPQGTASAKFCIATNIDAKVDSMTMPDADAADGTPLACSFHVATSGFDYAAHG